MWQYALKTILSAVVLVAVAEIAKRSSFWGAALASLLLTSLLAFIWLYLDSGETQKVIALSQGIFWLILPSLVLFIALPLLLRAGVGFWLSLGIACLATAGSIFRHGQVTGGTRYPHLVKTTDTALKRAINEENYSANQLIVYLILPELRLSITR